MRRTEPEHATLDRTDCRETALALRVLAHRIETEASEEADGDALLAAKRQAARLQAVAKKFEQAERLEFRYEEVLKALEDGAAAPEEPETGVLAFEPADLLTAAEALRLLAGRLREARDPHAKKINELAEMAAMAAEYLIGFDALIAKLAAGAEEERRSLPPEEESG